jgi:hypothetical protein
MRREVGRREKVAGVQAREHRRAMVVFAMACRKTRGSRRSWWTGRQGTQAEHVHHFHGRHPRGSFRDIGQVSKKRRKDERR